MNISEMDMHKSMRWQVVENLEDERDMMYMRREEAMVDIVADVERAMAVLLP